MKCLGKSKLVQVHLWKSTSLVGAVRRPGMSIHTNTLEDTIVKHLVTRRQTHPVVPSEVSGDLFNSSRVVSVAKRSLGNAFVNMSASCAWSASVNTITELSNSTFDCHKYIRNLLNANPYLGVRIASRGFESLNPDWAMYFSFRSGDDQLAFSHIFFKVGKLRLGVSLVWLESKPNFSDFLCILDWLIKMQLWDFETLVIPKKNDILIRPRILLKFPDLIRIADCLSYHERGACLSPLRAFLIRYTCDAVEEGCFQSIEDDHVHTLCVRNVESDPLNLAPEPICFIEIKLPASCDNLSPLTSFVSKRRLHSHHLSLENPFDRDVKNVNWKGLQVSKHLDAQTHEFLPA
ncbi:hypothetical protein Tco_0950285 [Tanacetum coccineum]